MKERGVRWLFRFMFVLLILIMMYCLLLIKPFWEPVLTIAGSVLAPFLAAGFLSYLLHPLVSWLEDKGTGRTASILLIYFLFFGGIGYIGYLVIPLLIEQMNDLSTQIPALAEKYRSLASHLHENTSRWPEVFREQLEERMESAEIWVEKTLADIITWIVEAANKTITLAMIPFLSFYLLKDTASLKKAAWYITPGKWRNQLQRFAKSVDESLGGYIRGQMLICAIIGLAAALVFWVLGIRYPIMLGAIIGITNIIPYFGPLIGAVPVVAIAAASSLQAAATAAVVVFVLQFVEGNLLAPLIAGKTLHMHPLVIIAALLAGGEAGGVLGLIVAVPIAALVKIAIIQVKNHFTKINTDL